MINQLRTITPKPVLDAYHWLISRISALFYGFPSSKLVVIGVTGTNGKSTVVNFIGRILEANGSKVGWTTTANMKIADKEWLNDTKMTMLGRFQLQRLLRKMVKSGCRYAVIETSSQGIIQHRHKEINYDTVVFTNLTPEHIEAHGGFENYKKAKLELFRHLSAKRKKIINGAVVPKRMVVNISDEHCADFLLFPADEKFGFGIDGRINSEAGAQAKRIIASGISMSEQGSEFNALGERFKIKIPGAHNIENALAAIAVGYSEGIAIEKLGEYSSSLRGVPGRMEFVDEGQNFSVLIDYAPEPASFARLYEAIPLFAHNRVIHVLGSAGGGRDSARREVLGRMAGAKADVVIVTNEDPYDEDPAKIIDEVSAGAVAVGKREGAGLFKILDRKQAIARAFALAKEGDLVVITGKGCEQAIVVGGRKKIKWDDRVVARELLKNLN